MRQIETSIQIIAPASTVWQHLTRFTEYSKWNPFIVSVEGDPVVHQSLKTIIQPPGGKAMTFKPVVLKAEPNAELRWVGRFLFKGLFDGEHYFKIEDNDDGGVTFIQGELFKGILVPLMKGALVQTEAGFNAMNETLKARCEQRKGL